MTAMTQPYVSEEQVKCCELDGGVPLEEQPQTCKQK